MQSTVSVLMAAIVFIVEFFSGILSSASDREPAKPDKPDKPAVSSTLTVFSRNDEFSDLVGKYQPEGARLNFVSEYIDFEDYDDVLEYGWRGQTVDIIICDSAEICRFLDSVLPMKDIGISEAEVSGLFSFNTESGRNSSGELCALPVVNAPGVFLYKRSAAKKLFGTDDPETVQSHISDWKKFLETAELARSKGIAMTTNAYEMYFAFAGGSSFTDKNGKLSVPSAAMDWLSAAKKMTDSGCLRGGYSWSNEWMESFADPDIFGHFTASWFIEGVLPTITNSDDYAVCAGPQYFIWGGSYALVNPQCKNREAAAELLRSVCISGSMDTSSQDTTVIPGNRAKFAAMQPIELPQLGGQDIGKVYIEVMDSVPPLTGKNSADRILSDNFHAFMLGYLNGDLGDISITEAVDQYFGQF